jgi:hypothetical protein
MRAHTVLGLSIPLIVGCGGRTPLVDADSGPALFCGPGTVQIANECVPAGAYPTEDAGSPFPGFLDRAV